MPTIEIEKLNIILRPPMWLADISEMRPKIGLRARRFEPSARWAAMFSHALQSAAASL